MPIVSALLHSKRPGERGRGVSILVIEALGVVYIHIPGNAPGNVSGQDTINEWC